MDDDKNNNGDSLCVRASYVATAGSFMLAKPDDRLLEDEGRRRSESCKPNLSFLWTTE